MSNPIDSEEYQQPQSESTSTDQANVAQFPHLPYEMLRDIVGWAAIMAPGDGPVLKSLCLATHTFRALVQPILLEIINLGTKAMPREKIIRQIEELAEENTGHPAIKYARTLIIDYDGLFKEGRCTVSPPFDNNFIDTFFRAVQSFERVENMVWYPRKNEPIWLHQAIAASVLKRTPKKLCINWLDSSTNDQFASFNKIFRISFPKQHNELDGASNKNEDGHYKEIVKIVFGRDIYLRSMDDKTGRYTYKVVLRADLLRFSP